ncbi:FG-GAP repeat domain-containing protein [Streptomyces sp. NPDC056661]|uniref:FG-GAP repeat domain-containing protein n=1 Tax=Streptomyces sp. NPDC056661 TaxID=3345898 RepID=UPI00367EDF4A
MTTGRTATSPPTGRTDCGSQTEGESHAHQQGVRGSLTYTHITGVGDLNGDGFGDLLACRSDGTLFRYDGTGAGQFKERVTVFTAWGKTYNAMMGVGDIAGDGKGDLVVRDTSGNLYRNDGKGNGSFTSRTHITTGWQGYKGLF